jgi:hypothetical protein
MSRSASHARGALPASGKVRDMQDRDGVASGCAVRRGAGTRLRPLAGLLGALLAPAFAAQTVVPGPDAGTRRFGAEVVVLPGGNYLVTDPEWALNAGNTLVGAVYLYRADGVLLSRLTGGAAGDRIGSGGIVVLPGGDFVVLSPSWRASPVKTEAGAVTWGDADLGFGVSAEVGAANSLVGSSAGDRIGSGGVVPLADGSFVVASGEWDLPGSAANVGAVTWCAADGSTTGPVTPANSLVGATAEDRIGDATVLNQPAVVALANGHYVVVGNRWDNGAVADVGAVTWARGDGATVGEVGAANSLVGASTGDYAGAVVQALANGHYIVQSPYFDHGGVGNVGAVTWADGGAPTAGTLSAANSLIGSQEYDVVGLYAAVLANGHYVVSSPVWDNGTLRDVGAVTWRDGSGPAAGVVGPANSLVGTAADDSVGYFTTIGIPPLGVVPLANGHYVVASPAWDSGAVPDAGAATWADAGQPLSGEVSAQNSLVGSADGDAIAQYLVTLPNGNYVVGSPYWSESRGAATWGNGLGGTVGVLDAGNSLVGTQPLDFVTSSYIYPLHDGDYVVASSLWNQGETLRVGAVTRGSGSSGIAGEVSPQNSVVGNAQDDRVGLGGVASLPGGGFLVRSALASGLGAISRIDAPLPAADATVNAANALVGKSETDRIGAPGASVQADGAILLHTANIAADGAGAITLFDRSDRFVGTLSEEDTVRSAVADGGPSLARAYLAASGTLVVGDPAGNRIVLVAPRNIFRDGYETPGD